MWVLKHAESFLLNNDYQNITIHLKKIFDNMGIVFGQNVHRLVIFHKTSTLPLAYSKYFAYTISLYLSIV